MVDDYCFTEMAGFVYFINDKGKLMMLMPTEEFEVASCDEKRKLIQILNQKSQTPSEKLVKKLERKKALYFRLGEFKKGEKIEEMIDKIIKNNIYMVG